jgi:hypothetical protein
VKSGLPHLRVTADGREGLITDPDGAVWRLRLGGDAPVLEWLGLLDLPEGHRLAGAVRTGEVNGPTAGTTLFFSTVEGRQNVEVDGLGTIGFDDTVTHIWQAELPASTPHPGMANPVGLSTTPVGSWVCDEDGATATGLGDALLTDDTFATCTLYDELPSGPVVVGDQTVRSTPLDTYFWIDGWLRDEDGSTNNYYRYSPNLMLLDTSPFHHDLGFTFSNESHVWRDPWSGDLFAYGHDRENVVIDLDGNLTPLDVAPSPWSAGGGGRLLDEDGTVRLPDGSTFTIDAGLDAMVWADGRWCAPTATGHHCQGSDGLLREGFYNPTPAPLGTPSRVGLYGGMVDADLAYIEDGSNLWSLDPETARVTHIDSIEPWQGSTTLLFETHMLQDRGGRTFYTNAEGATRSVLDGGVSDYGLTGLAYPISDEMGLLGDVFAYRPYPLVPEAIDGDAPLLAPVDTVFGSMRVGAEDLPPLADGGVGSSSGAFVYAGHNDVNHPVVFAGDSQGLVEIRPDGLVELAFDGTEGALLPWTTTTPLRTESASPLVSGDGTRLVLFEEQFQSTVNDFLPHVFDLIDLSSAPLATGMAPAEGWMRLTADGGSMFHIHEVMVGPIRERNVNRTDLLTGNSVLVLPAVFATGSSIRPTSFQISPHGEVLLATEHASAVYGTTFTNADNAAVIAQFEGRDAQVSPDGSLLVTDEHVYALSSGPAQLGMGPIQGSLDRPDALPGDLVFSPSGDRAAVFRSHLPNQGLTFIEIYAVDPQLGLTSEQTIEIHEDVMVPLWPEGTLFSMTAPQGPRLIWSPDSQVLGLRGFVQNGVPYQEVVLRFAIP